MPFTITIVLVSIFLLAYGIRSLNVGLKNEKKSYWFIIGYSQGLKDLLKDKYPKFLNIAGGALSAIGGLMALLILLSKWATIIK